MISQNELYDKLRFAKQKYLEYTLQVAERYSTGNINKKIPLKLNVISNWLAYLDERISLVVSVPLTDPAILLLDNLSIDLVKSSRQNFPRPNIEVLYIKDNFNRTVPISQFNIKKGLTPQELASRIIGGANNAVVKATRLRLGYSNIKVASAQKDKESVHVELKNTGSSFNNQKIKSGSGLVSVSSTKAVKGVNSVYKGSPIAYDTITSYNTILDTIALDLKFSYSSTEFKSFNSSYSKNLSLSEVQAATAQMLTEAGITITDEFNNSLTFE
tara:strand:+ start:42 stop:857 length:816 start_codon:yes stop_codon:yes gene_type:complete